MPRKNAVFLVPLILRMVRSRHAEFLSSEVMTSNTTTLVVGAWELAIRQTERFWCQMRPTSKPIQSNRDGRCVYLALLYPRLLWQGLWTGAYMATEPTLKGTDTHSHASR